MVRNRINYNKAVLDANSISDLAMDLDTAIKELEALLNQVKLDWKSPASEAYQDQLIMLIADMKTTQYNMSRVSTTIKNAADKIRKEDESLAMLKNF